jgi:hypothetical protein
MAKDGTGKKKTGAVETGEDLDNLKDAAASSDSAASGESSIDGEKKLAGAETALVEEDQNGNRFLPGSEIPVPKEIKPLIEKAKEIEKVLKPAFAKSRDALVTAQDKLSEIAHKNIEHFSEPDDKGTRTYKCGGVTVRITFEKEKITTKLDEDAD